MAKNNTPTNDAKIQPQPPAESQYSAKDLAGAARKSFGVPPEVVKAALLEADKDKFTMPEARLIVQRFMRREVK